MPQRAAAAAGIPTSPSAAARGGEKGRSGTWKQGACLSPPLEARLGEGGIRSLPAGGCRAEGGRHGDEAVAEAGTPRGGAAVARKAERPPQAGRAPPRGRVGFNPRLPCAAVASEEITFQLKMAADTSVDILQKVLENEILQSTKVVEEHLDAEIQKLDQMDEDELERLKQRRLEALKKTQQQKQEWLSKGHGEYREIPSERDFFQEVKESKNVVCHFYRDTTFRCQIMDKHLTVLAKKHIETKFLKLNAEKSPFLCERLRIKVIPTLALIKDGKTHDYVVGFTDLGNTDDFTTETLEWRLGCADVINYSGNLMDPPFQSQKKYGTSFTKVDKKTIRGKIYDSDSDDD